MKRETKWLGLALAGLFAASVAGEVMAQNAGGGRGGAPAQGGTAAQPGGGGRDAGGRDGGRGGRGGFDPAQWRQRMMDGIKESLGVADEEWKLLQPKIEKITTLQQQLRGGMFGGRRGGAEGAPTSEVEQKAQALRTALENKETKNDELAQKATALRTAREKVRTEIAKAQTELRELLTPRQEAQLVLQGILD